MEEIFKFEELDDPETFDALRKVAERDNRECWIWWHNLKTIHTIREAVPWLRGETEVIPQNLPSAALDPGDDNDIRQTHQRCAYARAAVAGGRTDTYNYMMMKATDYRVLAELELLGACELICEARQWLDDNYAYQERADSKRHSDEIVRTVLHDKAMTYRDIMKRLHRHFRERERIRAGENVMTPGEQEISIQVDEVHHQLETLSRKLKHSPASARTQAWVLERWKFYNKHPKALKGLQERKRVYLRDVWDTIREEATGQYGIASLGEFRKILRTVKQGIRRMK